MKTIMTQRYLSVIGELTVGSYGGKLCLCNWAEGRRRESIERRLGLRLNSMYEEGTTKVIEDAVCQLDEFFAGKRTEFDIPLLFTGSSFQCTVWTELMKIPYGATISYHQLACRVGNPKGVRAVASANGSNPISIFVPCHRVIGSDGRLVGYGGGLDVKEKLLSLEHGVGNCGLQSF